MSVIVDRPPNFEQILKAFPNAANDGVIFAFGDLIYNPSGRPIPDALMQHEAVHQQQHHKQGGPLVWWEAYINDPEFRYRQELYAHAAEYKAQVSGLDRNHRAKLLMSTAARLVAPLYNYVPPRALSIAMRDLRWELEP